MAAISKCDASVNSDCTMSFVSVTVYNLSLRQQPKSRRPQRCLVLSSNSLDDSDAGFSKKPPPSKFGHHPSIGRKTSLARLEMAHSLNAAELDDQKHMCRRSFTGLPNSCRTERVQFFWFVRLVGPKIQFWKFAR